jgi:hypothetical protein
LASESVFASSMVASATRRKTALSSRLPYTPRTCPRRSIEEELRRVLDGFLSIGGALERHMQGFGELGYLAGGGLRSNQRASAFHLAA